MNDLALRMDHLEVELHRLRRHNRWLRRIVAVLALLGCFYLSASADPKDTSKETTVEKVQAGEVHAKSIQADEIRAERFVVTTSGGTARAVLQPRTDGRQGLEIRDGNRKVLLTLPEKE